MMSKMKKLNELFAVRYGHSLELNALKKATPGKGVAFVSRQMGDNGVSAFVEPIEGVEPAQAGELSVALGGNGVLSTFIQEHPFYTGRDVMILTNIHGLSKAELLYYCVCIKANRYRYSYGRQANRTLKDMPLPKPVDIPEWVEDAGAIDFAGKDAPAVVAPTLSLNTTTWRPFQLADLFDLKKGKRLTKAKMTPGDTPFIGAIDSNNGLVRFVGQPPLHPANTMTVNYNGNGVAEAYYQPTPYRCTDDVNVLYPKFALTLAIGLFIAAVIRKEKYRFSYGRKWHLERMEQSEIHLPARPNGEPDWGFMERYIKTLPFSSQI
jgi:hypothetical protein